MRSRADLAPLSPNAAAWLVALADPLARVPVPSRPLAADELRPVLRAADAHAVLPVVTRNLRGIVGEREPSDIIETRTSAAALLASFLAEADRRTLLKIGRALLLEHHAGRVLSAFARHSIPAALIKGPVFARLIYPEPSDRTFTDVDILVPPEAMDSARKVLADLHFDEASIESRGGREFAESKWSLPDDQLIIVELQTNLIHSPLGSGIGFGYADLLAAGSGDPEDPAALLLVAAVHGAGGHQFDRLCHVVDVLQAGRSGARQGTLPQTGALAFALKAALDLAARLFADRAMTDLARVYPLSKWDWLAKRLLTPSVVLRAQTLSGERDSWRRQAFRELIRRSADRR